MVINVTQEHISKGKRLACHECPVALAIAEVVKPEHEVMVDCDISILNQSAGILWDAEYPPEVEEFIRAFDGDQPVEPFSFELDIPRDLLRGN
jgi:hypothetical protein